MSKRKMACLSGALYNTEGALVQILCIHGATEGVEAMQNKTLIITN